MNAAWIDTIRLARRRRRHGPGGPGYRFVELEGAVMRLREAGGGPHTLVLAADPPNVLEHYDELLARLGGWARVVCFEAPGFGYSVPRPGYRFTLREQAATVVALLEVLDQSPFTLAFSCVAALAALAVASDRPDLVEALVLIQAPSWSEGRRWARSVDPRGILHKPVAGQLFTWLRQRQVAQSWYEVALPRRSAVTRDHFTRTALAAFDRGAGFSLASAFQGLFTREPHLAMQTQPALVVWGSADRSHRRTDKGSILQHAPRATIVELTEAGHFPELERSERFSDLVRDFLTRATG